MNLTQKDGAAGGVDRSENEMATSARVAAASLTLLFTTRTAAKLTIVMAILLLFVKVATASFILVKFNAHRALNPVTS